GQPASWRVREPRPDGGRSQERRVTGRNGADQRVLRARDGTHDDGDGQPRSDPEGLVRNGEGPPEQPPRQLAVGGWLGVVVVRCGESHENNLDQLQEGLSLLPRSSPANG